MSKVIDQCRLCRRAGVKLYLKGDRCHTPKCAIVRRNYPPGVHGAKKGKPRLTTYGIQLREKQKCRFYYGLSEKQLGNSFAASARKIGDTGEILFQFLESRLDNVVAQLGWTGGSHRRARQAVSYGHILVDGKKVTIPSYHVKTGQTITLNPRLEKSKLYQDVLAGLEKRDIPGWLHTDKKSFQAKVVGQPNLVDNRPLFDMKLIVEFYSR